METQFSELKENSMKKGITPFKEEVNPVWKGYTDKNGIALVDKISAIK